MTDPHWDEVSDPPRYYDRDGRPLSLRQWAHLMEDVGYRTVGLTRVGPFDVSTVWLGLDHAFLGGPPLIFETMVFGGDELEQERYTTEAQARLGHERMVRLMRGRGTN